MSEERNFAEEASREGWVPQEQWKGDPKKWTDAETFVQNGERIAGIAVKKARNLEATVEELNARLAEVELAKQDFVAFTQKSLERERREKEILLERLEAQQAEAVGTGDTEAFKAATRQIKEIQSAKPPPAQTEWAKEWAKENDWYTKDAVSRAVANDIAEQLRNQGYKDEGRNFLDEVTRRTQEMIPERFENPVRRTSITSGAGKASDETASPKARSYEALPDAAKAVCDRLVAQGLLKQKDYIRDYSWD